MIVNSSIDERRKEQMTDCDHNYVYRGLEYTERRQLAGTGAKAREYFDVYYCNKCLHEVFRSRGYIGNSYQEPLDGAIPRASAGYGR